MRVTTLLLGTVSLSVLFAAPAAADDAGQGPEAVVVTAGRMPELREQTGSSTSIITADDLKNEQTLVVTDALAETPALEVIRTGGVGQTATISLRGAEAGQTLVLIDGIRINDPSSVDGEAVLGDLLANNIDRIEILRGPQSTLYGSDAIGGVVDIMTRRGGSTPFGLNADAEGGSFDTYRLNVGANGSADDVDYGAAANFYHTNGISAADSRYGNPDTAHYTNFGATENVRLNVSDTVSVDLRTYFTNARDDFDDNYLYLPTLNYYRVADSGAYNTDILFAGYGGINFDLFGDIHNRVAVVGTDSVRKFFDSASDIIHENADDSGTALRFEYQGIVDIGAADHLTFGAETEQTRFDDASFSSDPLYASNAQGRKWTSGIYAQDELTVFDTVTLTGGTRYERDEEFGGHVSFKLAGAWALDDGSTILRANYGDGFKAPSLFELFSQYSNPLVSLRPEVARGWEAGLDQFVLGGSARLAATWFDRDTSDQIDFFNCYGPTTPACDLRYVSDGYYFNIGRSRARGFESEATLTLSDTLKASLSYTDMTAIVLSTDSDAGLTAGNDLAREPHVMANASLFWTPIAPLTAGASIGYVGRRWDDVGNTIPLHSNTVSNIYGSYALNDSLELFARIENLFNARYEPVFGYGAPGRAVYAGLRAHY